MKVGPAISVENQSDYGYIKIYYDLPVFVGKEGKKVSAADFKDCYIRTNYIWHDTHTDNDCEFIKILTEHRAVWYEYLTNTTSGLLNEYIGRYLYVNITNYDEGDPDSPLCILIEPIPPYDMRVVINVVKIGVQTGAGVVTTK
ncbi:MAG TPA: hypothetical protein ENN45_02070 [Bacteroidetes bacterium]|nr:hypothetical protein [Bacteroidota bacterium]